MHYTIQDNNLLIAENEKALTRFYENVLPLPVDYQEGKYIVNNGELVINSEFEAQKEAEEQERISMLSLTSADVERGIYKATGKDFEDIVAYVQKIASSEPINDDADESTILDNASIAGSVDIKALKIELKANNFYRGNPYVETVGSLLGFTKKQLDNFFETNDYTKLLKEE